MARILGRKGREGQWETVVKGHTLIRAGAESKSQVSCFQGPVLFPSYYIAM